MSSHVKASNHVHFSAVRMYMLAINIRIVPGNYVTVGRSQWPRGLKRRSAAARLLRLGE